MAQLAGDVGQPGAEQEHMHPVAIVGHRVQEMQQDLRVAAIDPEMSHSTTSGGGRVTWRLRAMVRISPPWRRLWRMVRRRSVTGPARVGAQPPRAAQIERQHQAADFRAWRRRSPRRSSPRSPLLQPFLLGHGQHRVRHRRLFLGAGLASRGCAIASATRRLPGAARSGCFSFCASSSAIATACSAAVGSRQNRSNAWSNTS